MAQQRAGSKRRRKPARPTTPSRKPTTQKKEPAPAPASDLSETELDLLQHLQNGYVIETDTLGSDVLLRRTKDKEAIRTVFVLHPLAAPDFIAAIKKVNDGLGKQADWPKTSGWLLNDAYGKEMADQIQKTVRDCTAHQFTDAAVYRADLSYTPGK